jgi:hypothetical protein
MVWADRDNTTGMKKRPNELSIEELAEAGRVAALKAAEAARKAGMKPAGRDVEMLGRAKPAAVAGKVERKLAGRVA